MTHAELIAKWRSDVSAFCAGALSIHSKSDQLVHFRLNPAQRVLAQAVTRQKRATGHVRMLVPKARQLGVSTWTAARFFRDLLLRPEPVRALVMAQDDVTAKSLKRIYATYWETMDPNLRRARARSNDHEEEYAHGALLVSRTASTKTGMRGGTIGRLHGSELAYWQHAEEHAAGAMQQLSKEPGSEMILESTANGPTGAWYERVRQARAGEGEFEVCFLPWTLMPEYASAPPQGFTLRDDAPNDLIPSEREYAAAHGCSPAQMAWRRAKIHEFAATGADGALIFAREYPVTLDEAFLAGGELAFIAPSHVAAALKRNDVLAGYVLRLPLTLGIDVATEHGPNATCLIRRRGHIAYELERLHGIGLEQLIQRVHEIVNEEHVDRVAIDVSEGTGFHLARRLALLSGCGGRVIEVSFGATAHAPDRYANRRAEIWDRMRQWMPTGQIPDEHPPPGQAPLSAELLGPQRKDANERLLTLESKKDMRMRGVASPDGADALACTFAVPDAMPGARGNVVVESDALSALENVYTRPPRGPDGNWAAAEGMF